MTTVSVTRRGTAEKPIFDFVIPSGPKGETGIGWGGTGLGSADLDTITTPGIYRQPDGALAVEGLHYPFLKFAGAISVVPWGGTEVMQIATPIPTSVTVGITGTYTRGKRSGWWSDWKFTPAQRVDNTVGRTIYTWDNTGNREQLIYGDTGWRVLNDDAEFMKSIGTKDITFEPGRTQIRRQGFLVFLKVTYRKNIADAISPVNKLPAGWRPSQESSYYAASANLTGGRIWMTSSGQLTYQGAATYNGQDLTLTMIYPTNDAWPTSLPGVTYTGAAPAIPNL